MENKKYRQAISNLYLSNHTLETELGRYKTKSKERIPECQRICKLCDMQQVKDEIHVLLQGPTYIKERNKFLERIIFVIFVCFFFLTKQEQQIKQRHGRKHFYWSKIYIKILVFWCGMPFNTTLPKI